MKLRIGRCLLRTSAWDSITRRFFSALRGAEYELKDLVTTTYYYYHHLRMVSSDSSSSWDMENGREGNGTAWLLRITRGVHRLREGGRE